jgi:hypothetical protein
MTPRLTAWHGYLPSHAMNLDVEIVVGRGASLLPATDITDFHHRIRWAFIMLRNSNGGEDNHYYS